MIIFREIYVLGYSEIKQMGNYFKFEEKSSIILIYSIKLMQNVFFFYIIYKIFHLHTPSLNVFSIT